MNKDSACVPHETSAKYKRNPLGDSPMAKLHVLDARPDSRFFSPAQAEFIKARYNYCCAACGSTRRSTLEADHWMPFDGANTIVSNGVALCSSCNKVKHNKAIDAYYRLEPREPMPWDMPDRDERLDANTESFKVWCKTTKTKRSADIKFKPLY
jgi:5-methylcytosine-specific restriction endonuclease McrA